MIIIIELIFNALLILVLLRWKRGIASEIKFVEKYLVYKINLFIFASRKSGIARPLFFKTITVYKINQIKISKLLKNGRTKTYRKRES